MAREMNESHEALLKTALKLNENDELPENVVDIYWQVETTARRLHLGIGCSELLLVALFSNRPTPEDPVSFMDLVYANKVHLNDRVVAKFRNQWRWGWFKGVKDDKVVVQLDDDTAEEREFAPTGVRIPSKDEKRKIGEK